MSSYKHLKALFAVAASILWMTPAFADYPEKPVRLIVPVSPGGGTDQLARLLGQKLGEMWKQAVVVENKPGAGGNIGAKFVAEAPPDGYSLLLTYGANVVVNPVLYRSAGFTPAQFVPITGIASTPNLLVVHPSVPAQNVEQLVGLMKEKKEKWSYTSSPVGAPDYLSGELFRMRAGVDLLNIPYKGGAAGLIDVLGGRVQMTFATIPVVGQHVKSGGVRALAITDTRRSKLFPDVPTVAETLPGFEGVVTWYGIWAPVGTPAAVVNKVAGDVRRVLALPEADAFLQANGFDKVASAPAEFTEFNRTEAIKYAEIIRASGVRLD